MRAQFSPLLNPLMVLARFLRSESAGGFILIVSAVVALIWSNSAAAPWYVALLHLKIGGTIGSMSHAEEFHLWVNDGLMAIFFLLVGLELRREMTTGELASVKRVALPGLAALGGMIVPALIYLAINWGDPAALRGWAVPVATDIAFALAVISTLGKRVPIGLKVFLTALAIMDDLGAILVIAVFYTRNLDLALLGWAAGLWFAIYLMGRAGVRSLVPYLVGGLVLWVLLFQSGVHATLAGVALAFAMPIGSKPAEDAEGEDDEEPVDTRNTSPALKLEYRLTPLVFYCVLPLFGLANAGLELHTLSADMLTDTVAIGILLGLLVGKQVGVFSAIWLAVRFRVAHLPSGCSMLQMYGGAILCGIGFTMSLFIGDLSFRGEPRGEEVKLAVFSASLIAAVMGLAWLAWFSRKPARVMRREAAAD